MAKRRKEEESDQPPAAPIVGGVVIEDETGHRLTFLPTVSGGFIVEVAKRLPTDPPSEIRKQVFGLSPEQFESLVAQHQAGGS